MLRLSVVVVSLLVNAPTLWAAFGRQTASVDTALVRLLITIPIVVVLLGGVRLAMKPAPPPHDPERPDTEPAGRAQPPATP